jgi:peptide/histidine transporter 3/4
MSTGARHESKLRNVVGFIIVTEFCERIAYYGFAGSLVLFFQSRMNMDNSEADVQYSIWSAVVMFTPWIGGYVADAFLGRYLSILVSDHLNKVRI